MPRHLPILLLTLALPGFAVTGQVATADQRRAEPPVRPAAVVYGVRHDAVPTFAPRSRVQGAARREAMDDGASTVVVVRGMQVVAGTLGPELGGSVDPALIHALAALCRIDASRRDALAVDLTGPGPIPARF